MRCFYSSGPGDIILVYKTDRIFRSLKNMIDLIELFNKKEVKFKSITEPAFDTTTANGKFLIQIFGAVAEFERNLIQRENQSRTGRSEAPENFSAAIKVQAKNLWKSIILPNIFMRIRISRLIRRVFRQPNPVVKFNKSCKDLINIPLVCEKK